MIDAQMWHELWLYYPQDMMFLCVCAAISVISAGIVIPAAVYAWLWR